MRSDQEVIGADGQASSLQFGAGCAVFAIRRNVRRQYGNDFKHAFHLGQRSGRGLPGAAIAQVRRDDDAGVHVLAADLFDVPSSRTRRIADEVADDVGVQQVAVQNCRRYSVVSMVAAEPVPGRVRGPVCPPVGLARRRCSGIDPQARAVALVATGPAVR